MGYISEIEICNLSFAFDNNQIFDNLCLKFKKNTSYALLGKNGVGKTTLINILIGLYKEYTGEIFYNSQSLKQMDSNKLRKSHISFIEQEPDLIQDTLFRNITLDIALTQGEVRKLLGEWLDNSKFNNLNTEINEKSNNLSGGEKEKIAIMRAIIKDSEIIIMDEPTAALDSDSCKEVEKLIQSIWKRKIVLVVTHDEKLADICDEKIYI